MQIKIDHFYLKRNGHVAGPIRKFCITNHGLGFKDPRFGATYTFEGHQFTTQKSDQDLVKELGSAADGWRINNGIQPDIEGRVEAICRDGSTLTFPARVAAYWSMSNLPSAILLYRRIQTEPNRKRAERLAHALLLRMKEIDGDIKVYKNEVADCHDYSLLWDAILDEVKHACPDLNVDEVLDVRSV
jgi:hypothetical protein